MLPDINTEYIGSDLRFIELFLLKISIFFINDLEYFILFILSSSNNYFTYEIKNRELNLILINPLIEFDPSHIIPVDF